MQGAQKLQPLVDACSLNILLVKQESFEEVANQQIFIHKLERRLSTNITVRPTYLQFAKEGVLN